MRRVEATFERVGRWRVWEELRRRQAVQKAAEEIMEFRWHLDEWRGVCVRYRVAERKEFRHRSQEECEKRGEEQARQMEFKLTEPNLTFLGRLHKLI